VFTSATGPPERAERPDLCARRADRVEQLASELDAVAVPGDIACAVHRQALAAAVSDRFGRLDILINNAGICDDGPLEDQTLDELTTVIQVNLIAVLDLCRLMAPLLFASEQGSVINISSIYGLVASREPMAGCNSAKAALVGLTRHLAAQSGPRRVRVNALAPGYFSTELTGMLDDPGFVAHIESQTLLARAPVIDELDGPLLFLASDASSYVTGHTLVVDVDQHVRTNQTLQARPPIVQRPASGLTSLTPIRPISERSTPKLVSPRSIHSGRTSQGAASRPGTATAREARRRGTPGTCMRREWNDAPWSSLTYGGLASNSVILRAMRASA
jgi:NAD(P)-dependent dehydrogenase (short-subunit alcohol dehydrogenase family)